MRFQTLGVALLLCMLIAVSVAEFADNELQPATKMVYLGKQQSVPVQVPVVTGTKGASFTWSGLMVEVMKGTAVNIGATLGYDLVNSLTGNFFGLLDEKPDTEIMEQLKVIENLVRQVDYKIDALTKDVAKVQISVQLGNVKYWTTEVQGMFDVMNNIFQAAPYQSPNVTKRSIMVLVDEIRRNAYASALGIYNAMVVPTAVEDPILSIVFDYVNNEYARNTDALDVYGILRSFSTQYVTPLTQASTLLRYASNATADHGLLQLAIKVDSFIASWDEYFETGPKAIMPPTMTTWARKILEGSPDEKRIGWNAVFDFIVTGVKTNAQCGAYVMLVNVKGNQVSMRRDPVKRYNTWVFSTTNGTSASPKCPFWRASNDLIMPMPGVESGYWSVYYFKGPENYNYNFAVNGYATSSDLYYERNLLNWLDGRPDTMSRAASITSMQKPPSGRTFYEFDFANGRVFP
jgi:hypothetical protein